MVGFTQGSLAGSKGDRDGFVRKYTTSGGVVWTRQFGTSGVDTAEAVAVDSGGNVYVVGAVGGSWNAEDALSRGDLSIRKYNAGGTFQWKVVRDYSANDFAMEVAVFGNNIYVVGGFDYNNDIEDSDFDVRVLRLSTSGSVVWDYGYGPVDDDSAKDVAVDGGGNAYIVGYTYTSLAGTNQGREDGFVLKLNSSGTRLWGKQVGTSETDYAVAVEVQGNALYAAGATYGALGGANNGDRDAFVTRLNSATGGTVWTD